MIFFAYSYVFSVFWAVFLEYIRGERPIFVRKTARKMRKMGGEVRGGFWGFLVRWARGEKFFSLKNDEKTLKKVQKKTVFAKKVRENVKKVWCW